MGEELVQRSLKLSHPTILGIGRGDFPMSAALLQQDIRRPRDGWGCLSRFRRMAVLRGGGCSLSRGRGQGRQGGGHRSPRLLGIRRRRRSSVGVNGDDLPWKARLQVQQRLGIRIWEMHRESRF